MSHSRCLGEKNNIVVSSTSRLTSAVSEERGFSRSERKAQIGLFSGEVASGKSQDWRVAPRYASGRWLSWSHHPSSSPRSNWCCLSRVETSDGASSFCRARTSVDGLIFLIRETGVPIRLVLAERFNLPEIRCSPRRYCSFGEGPTVEFRESSVLLLKIMSFLPGKGSGRKNDRLFKYCERRNNQSASGGIHESNRNAAMLKRRVDVRADKNEIK